MLKIVQEKINIFTTCKTSVLHHQIATYHISNLGGNE